MLRMHCSSKSSALMQRLVVLVLLLLPALAGSAPAARTDPASDAVIAAPWLHQLRPPHTESLSLAGQHADSRSVAVVDGMLRPLQHAVHAATRAVSQVFRISAKHTTTIGTESRHGTRVMRRHFVNGTDPSAVCNDGTPGTSKASVSAFPVTSLTQGRPVQLCIQLWLSAVTPYPVCVDCRRETLDQHARRGLN